MKKTSVYETTNIREGYELKSEIRTEDDATVISIKITATRNDAYAGVFTKGSGSRIFSHSATLTDTEGDQLIQIFRDELADNLSQIELTSNHEDNNDTTESNL